jgi:hypothetical protein
MQIVCDDLHIIFDQGWVERFHGEGWRAELEPNIVDDSAVLHDAVNVKAKSFIRIGLMMTGSRRRKADWCIASSSQRQRAIFEVWKSPVIQISVQKMGFGSHIRGYSIKH